MIDQIRPAAFAQWTHSLNGVAALVLDVREPWEVYTASVHAVGDAHAFEVLPMPMQEITARLGELPKDRPIACLCHHGVRSLQVARYLTQNGFEHVVNIAGGIDAWSAELDPSVPCY
jgi:rhodanese-related sulfurtransferase